jgi:hypothetical protein
MLSAIKSQTVFCSPASKFLYSGFIIIINKKCNNYESAHYFHFHSSSVSTKMHNANVKSVLWCYKIGTPKNRQYIYIVHES